MRIFLLLCSLLVISMSCIKTNSKAGNNVEMYLLSSYQSFQGKYQVDSSHSSLEINPFLKNEDVLYYTWSSFQYKLSARALQKVKALLGRTPFAITVDKEVIFYGFYMLPILSSNCFNSITFAESWDQSSSIAMNLG